MWMIPQQVVTIAIKFKLHHIDNRWIDRPKDADESTVKLWSNEFGPNRNTSVAVRVLRECSDRSWADQK